MKIRIIAIISLSIFPSLSYATTGPLGSLVDLANTLAGGVVTSLGYLMFTLAVVAFFAGIVKFIWAIRNGDSGKEVENGKQFMLWGLIALFVMFSVWGIIKFAQNVFNIQNETSIVIPNIKLLGAPASSSAGSGITAVGSGVTTVCPNGPRSVCSITDINTGKTVNGICNNTGMCDVTPTGNTSSVAVDPFCLARGKDAECTVTDINSGKTTAGHCNASNQCIPDSGTPPIK